MTRLHHLLLAAALCAASPASAASNTSPPADPLNRPAPGAQIKPNVSTGQSLGMAILGAKVNSDTSFDYAVGATGATHLTTGTYEVDFNRDVSSCIYSASVYFPDDTTFVVQPRTTNASGVYLHFKDLSSKAIDASFYLTVFCNR